MALEHHPHSPGHYHHHAPIHQQAKVEHQIGAQQSHEIVFRLPDDELTNYYALPSFTQAVLMSLVIAVVVWSCFGGLYCLVTWFCRRERVRRAHTAFTERNRQWRNYLQQYSEPTPVPV